MDIGQYEKVILLIDNTIPGYTCYELLEYRLGIMSILVLSSLQKKQFELYILQLKGLIFIEKNKKKTSNGLNQYLLKFKV